MRLFKSKLRKRIEFYIEMIKDSNISLYDEIENRSIKQTLSPAEYAKYSVQINDNNSDIKLLQEILK